MSVTTVPSRCSRLHDVLCERNHRERDRWRCRQRSSEVACCRKSSGTRTRERGPTQEGLTFHASRPLPTSFVVCLIRFILKHRRLSNSKRLIWEFNSNMAGGRNREHTTRFQRFCDLLQNKSRPIV